MTAGAAAPNAEGLRRRGRRSGRVALSGLVFGRLVSATAKSAERATLSRRRHSFGASQLLYLPVKRVVDIVLGTVGCLITLPVAAVVKLSYLAAGDTHPIFYKQTRVGLRGQCFELWKLRSMVWDADEQLQRLLEDPAVRAEWDQNQKLAHDPRITPVGRMLRRASLDELPQFLNVLKGDMSAIGPRPLIPGELEAHGGRALYNKVKPGLTGLVGLQRAFRHRVPGASGAGVLLHHPPLPVPGRSLHPAHRRRRLQARRGAVGSHYRCPIIRSLDHHHPIDRLRSFPTASLACTPLTLM